MQKIKWIKLIISLIIPQVIGYIGSLFTITYVGSWYAVLNKASFNPPNWLFAPVWTILFVLMGISFYLIWSSEAKNKKLAYWVFGIQLALNLLWSILFFGLRSPMYALIEIIVLWLTILFMIISFSKISKTAAYLQLPYLLWVGFASILNLFIVVLN